MTSDDERRLVLAQNDLLRVEGVRGKYFQALRRCCICLKNQCDNQSECRKEFEIWAKKEWSRALQDEHVRRHPGEGSPRYYEGTGPD